jgi:hypothetical protein
MGQEDSREKVQEGRSLAEQEVPADIEDSKVKSR